MRKYYIEVDDKGNETKRTLTTFQEQDDLESMSLLELSEVYYQASAELSSKARKITMLERLIQEKRAIDFFTPEGREIELNFIEGGNNIAEAMEELTE